MHDDVTGSNFAGESDGNSGLYSGSGSDSVLQSWGLCFLHVYWVSVQAFRRMAL